MEILKKLTGKNPAEYEPAAKQLIDVPDVLLFKELVARDDYMFGFVKHNVARRILEACNENNYKNLYLFLPYYSPYYEDVIISVISRYDAQNAKDRMFDLLSSGTDDEKCYAAKFFVQNPDVTAAEVLRRYVFSENEYLSTNSIDALKKLNDEEAFKLGLAKLDSDDDYEVYSGVKLLTRWGDASLAGRLYDVMRKSSIPEYVALEINSLEPFINGLNGEYAEMAALALCHILSGLGELIPLDSIFELNMTEVLERLSVSRESYAAVVLMMAKRLFTEISDNDEYLFDLDKNTKDEVAQICSILSNISAAGLESAICEEAYEESPFICFVIGFLNDVPTMLSLLEGDNQTVILSTMERLKTLGLLNDEYKAKGLSRITNDNIRPVAEAL